MTDEIVQAITDLTRVTIALSGKFESRAEAIRQLHELSIPSGRIAAILAMSSNEVTSTIAKAKKKKSKEGTKK